MEQSFLNSIVSSALSAQEQQQSMTESKEASNFSGITEKDGYVGEMVKASLAIFEAKTPADYSKAFPEDVIVIINSLSVAVAGTPIDLESELNSIDSIQQLIDFISEETGVDLSGIQAVYGSDNKIHMEHDSEYGKMTIEVGVEAYKAVDTNTILGLPRA